MTQDRSSVVVIGVNYGTDDMSQKFVRSLSVVAEDTDVSIVLVDNSEGTNSSKLFGKIWADNPDVMCLKPPSNLGYFGGANFGLKEYLACQELPDWVIVSNVDIEFKDEAFFTYLRDVNYGEDLGVIAPSIYSGASQYDYNPYMVSRPSKLEIRFYTLLYCSACVFALYKLLSQMKSQLKCALTSKFIYDSNKDLKVIYAPHGALIIFSKTFFSRGGSLDYPAFLFNEELYVAEIARDVGVHVVYDPNLKVLHREHSSTNWLSLHKSVSYRRNSAVFIAERYFS